jgi:hypothetical protein
MIHRTNSTEMTDRAQQTVRVIFTKPESQSFVVTDVAVTVAVTVSQWHHITVISAVTVTVRVRVRHGYAVQYSTLR